MKIADPEGVPARGHRHHSAVEIDEITGALRRVIALAFADMVTESKLGAIDLQGHQISHTDKLREFVV